MGRCLVVQPPCYARLGSLAVVLGSRPEPSTVGGRGIWAVLGSAALEEPSASVWWQLPRVKAARSLQASHHAPAVSRLRTWGGWPKDVLFIFQHRRIPHSQQIHYQSFFLVTTPFQIISQGAAKIAVFQLSWASISTFWQQAASRLPQELSVLFRSTVPCCHSMQGFMDCSQIKAPIVIVTFTPLNVKMVVLLLISRNFWRWVSLPTRCSAGCSLTRWFTVSRFDVLLDVSFSYLLFVRSVGEEFFAVKWAGESGPAAWGSDASGPFTQQLQLLEFVTSLSWKTLPAPGQGQQSPGVGAFLSTPPMTGSCPCWSWGEELHFFLPQLFTKPGPLPGGVEVLRSVVTTALAHRVGHW